MFLRLFSFENVVKNGNCWARGIIRRDDTHLITIYMYTLGENTTNVSNRQDRTHCGPVVVTVFFLLFHCFDGWNIENIQDEKVNKQKIYLILSWCWPPIRLQYVSVLVSLSREKCSCNFWLWLKVSILSSRRQGNWCRMQTYWQPIRTKCSNAPACPTVKWRCMHGPITYFYMW